MYKLLLSAILFVFSAYSYAQPGGARIENWDCRVTVEESVRSADPSAPVRQQTRETLEKALRTVWSENGIEYRATDGRRLTQEGVLVNSFKTLLQKSMEKRGEKEIEHLRWTTTLSFPGENKALSSTSEEENTYLVQGDARTMVRSVLDGKEQPITETTESVQPNGDKLVISRIVSPFVFENGDQKTATSVVRFQKSCLVSKVQ